MSNHTWLRLYHDFLKDEKIISLAFEDQRHYIGILILKSEGTLDKNVDMVLLDRIVAQNLWIDHAIIREIKKRLIDIGLIDNDWQPLGWDNRQYPSDKDTTNAQRQRDYRARKKAEKNKNEKTSCVVTENDQNDEVSNCDTQHTGDVNGSNVTHNVTVTPTEENRIDTEEKRIYNTVPKKNTKKYFKTLLEDIRKSVPRKSKTDFTEKAYTAYKLIENKDHIKDHYIAHQELKEHFSQTIANFLRDYEANVKELENTKPKDTFDLSQKKYNEEDAF